MAEQIVIYVPVVPCPQPRQRHRVVTNKVGRTFAQNYTPSTIGSGDERRPNPIVAFKATVKMAARAAYKGPPMSGPVRVDIQFVLPRHKQKIWKSKPMPRYWDVGPNDRDNLDKGVLDALKGIVFVDDHLVCDGRIMKVRASGDEQAHALITVTPLSEGDCHAEKHQS